MMNRLLLLLAMLGTVLAAGACATMTRLSSSWQDPDYMVKPLRNVVVIAMAQDAEVSRFAENQAVRSFPAGVRARPGHLLFPGLEATPETVRTRIRAEGFDAALVSRLVAVDKSETYVPPATYVVPDFAYSPLTYDGPIPYRSLYGYYGYVMQQVTTPGYVREDTTVLVETLLYDAQTGMPVWSAVSETFNPRSTREAVDSIIATVMRELRTQGYLDGAPH